MGWVSSPAEMAARMVSAHVFGGLPSISSCRCLTTLSVRVLSTIKTGKEDTLCLGGGAAARSRMRIVTPMLSMEIVVQSPRRGG